MLTIYMRIPNWKEITQYSFEDWVIHMQILVDHQGRQSKAKDFWHLGNYKILTSDLPASQTALWKY